MRFCANCGCDLFGAKETGSSGLYAPNDARDYELCIACFDIEDALIEQEGTNNMPSLLAHYRRTLASRENA